MNDESHKRGEALRRAMPITRMMDYGLDESIAQAIHAQVDAGHCWEEVLTGIADAARTEGKFFTAAMAMNFAQMASNFDTHQRVELFHIACNDFERWVSMDGERPTRYQRQHGGGQLFGWDFPAPDLSAPAVIVVGGMSGWATSFVGMGACPNFCVNGSDFS